jgi:hypothetical protein
LKETIMATSSGGNKQGGKSEQGTKGGASKQSTSKSSENKQSDTSKRGFASMDPQQQREIASEGGRAAHEKGTAHEFTSEEARRAGSQSHKNDGNRQSASHTSADQGARQGGKEGSGSKSGGSGSGS